MSEKLKTEPIFSRTSEFPVEVSWFRGNYGWPPPLNRHREAELHFIKRGKGRYLIENRTYPFGRNSVIIIKPNEIHRHIFEAGTYFEKISLLFLPSLFKDDPHDPGLRRSLSSLPHHFRLSEKDEARSEFMLDLIAEEEKGREERWRAIIIGEIKNFVFLLTRNSRRQEVQPEKNPLIKTLVDYIEENFTRDLTLHALAGLVSRSSSHISRLFKKYVGAGPKQYILERRIVEARKILEEEPGLKVRLVAGRVGFHNFTVFNHHFKLITGVSASAYRRLSRRPASR